MSVQLKHDFSSLHMVSTTKFLNLVDPTVSLHGSPNAMPFSLSKAFALRRLRARYPRPLVFY